MSPSAHGRGRLPPGMSPAGFVSRLCAFVLDWIILSIAAALTTTMMHNLFNTFGLRLFKWGRYVLLGATLSTASLLAFLFLAVLWHAVGCSPGKAIVGLRVVREDGERPTLVQATLRLLGYWVSGIPFFLGFVWCLFDARHQTWHDKLARTFVVYAPLRVDRFGTKRTTLLAR
jgi:uncharacterized RDD family membrane protein YckC